MSNVKDSLDIIELYKEHLAMRLDYCQTEYGTYNNLFDCLFNIEYSYDIWQDENREADAQEMLNEWLHNERMSRYDLSWRTCSVLEVMMALAERMSYIASGAVDDNRPSYWFWRMIENIGFDIYTDDVWNSMDGDLNVERDISAMMNHEIEPDGRGGLFPLRDSKNDQRCIELWYQMNNWMVENVKF